MDELENIVNYALDKIHEWSLSNKVSLNISKSNFVALRPRQKKMSRPLTTKMNNESIVEKRLSMAYRKLFVFGELLEITLEARVDEKTLTESRNRREGIQYSSERSKTLIKAGQIDLC